MDAFATLVLKSGTKEALFLTLWLELGERPGEFRNVDLREIVKIAERRGLYLSEARVRARLNDLEQKSGVVERVDRREYERGRFDLLVFNPAPEPSGAIRPTRREESTPLFDAISEPNGARFHSRFHSENEIEIESRNETPAPVALAKSGEIPTLPTFGNGETEDGGDENANAPSKEINININKKINKPAKDLKISETFDDVRELIDFDAPNVAALRRAVVRDIWEPELHSELVDRIVFGLVRGIVGRAEWRGIVAEAQNRRDVYRRSKDGKGAATLWRTVAVKVKSAFDAAGWTWTATTNDREPEPSERSVRRAVADDDAAAPGESLGTLRAVVRGFDVADAELPLNELTRKVIAVRGVYGVAAQTTAITIRNALRRLRETEKAVGATA